MMLFRSAFTTCVVTLFVTAVIVSNIANNVAFAQKKPNYPTGYQAKVLSIYDGDTFTAQIFSWPQHSIEARVRLRGIDTPEIRGKCASEKAKAQQAKQKLQELIPEGSMVILHRIELGTYAGRIIANVSNKDGDDISAIMLNENYARAYLYREGRKSWCNL
ncbi:MAG: thermonuclease family protein [Alphaproteobacteria bacterium]|nr:thermonuclease family protein [Alphaproteobacteria bacterium]